MYAILKYHTLDPALQERRRTCALLMMPIRQMVSYCVVSSAESIGDAADDCRRHCPLQPVLLKFSTLPEFRDVSAGRWSVDVA